ncbi:OmpA/MotB family protein [Kineococcus sp. SYSU DK005]|uniref:OmpA/MotB family protein n=1 Tax=Kineococcus sp. SYSU DK005 TaxID=3383126 RepID=UPI003D7EEA88
MSSSAHKRRHKHEEHEEHVNHERWLVSYADMLTVLMALFIVLFALSQVDQLKFAQFKAGLQEGSASTNLVLSGNKGVNDIDNGADPINLKIQAGGDPQQSEQVQQVLNAAQKDQSAADLAAAQAEVARYREIEAQIDQALSATGDEDQVTYRITSDGLVVGLVADKVFFANASADVEPTGLHVLDVIGPILAALPNDIAVQGHTNSLPLSATTRYRDNWDLSSARANTVVTRFIAANGVSPLRLSGTGYADSRPLYPDGDPQALTGNRRVDLIVASPSSDAVKALLPQVAATTPTDGPAELRTEADAATAATTSTTSIAPAGIAPDLGTAVSGVTLTDAGH